MAKDRKVEEKVAVASDKIRQLEDNLLFRHITDSDKTSTWQQANITPPTGKLPSENTEELYKDIVGSAINILRGGSGEIYDDEGNVIAIGGSTPDIALGPLFSKKALYSLFGSPAKSIAYLKSIGTTKLNPKIAKKVWPKAKSKSELKNIPDTIENLHHRLRPPAEIKATKFGKFLENKSKKKLYKTLSTKEEFEKFKNTFPSSKKKLYPDAKWISGPVEMSYEGYKKWIKRTIYSDKNIGKIIHKLGPTFESSSSMGKVDALGSYSPTSQNIKIASELNPSYWGTVLRHEIKHKLDDFITSAYKSEDYKKLEKLFRSKVKPEIEKKLSTWEEFSENTKRFNKNKDIPYTPSEIRRIKYILEPTETLARNTEIKTKGLGQSLYELVGNKITARKDLESIYPKDFIKELQKKYWAAAPLSVGLNKDLDK